LTYISELDLTNLTQGTDDLSSDFIGNVELGQAHLRRAEEGILRSHGGQEAVRSQSLSTRINAVKEKKGGKRAGEGERRDLDDGDVRDAANDSSSGELVAVHVMSRDDISTYLSCLGHQQNNDNYILRDQLMSDGRLFNAA
jgi:hypothetical protein